jgi:hypothetical protein
MDGTMPPIQQNVPNLATLGTSGMDERNIGSSVRTVNIEVFKTLEGLILLLRVYSTLVEPFYASFGFCSCKARRGSNGEGCLFPVIFMRRELALSTSSDTRRLNLRTPETVRIIY